MTTGRFTAEAEKFAYATGIEMIGPQKLSTLMKQAFPNPDDLQAVEVMCSECNEVVVFDELQDYSFDDTRTCKNGHHVKNAVFIEDKRLAFSKTLVSTKPTSYRKRRRYRRY